MNASKQPKQPACDIRTRLDLQSFSSYGAMTNLANLFDATLPKSLTSGASNVSH